MGNPVGRTHGDEICGIPQFVTKIAVTFDAFKVKPHRSRAGCDRAKSEPKCIGPVSLDPVGVFFSGCLLYLCLLSCLQ